MKKEMTKQEEWKYVEGYGRRYLVSTHGRVMSLAHGPVRILKSGTNGRGYQHVRLYEKDGRDKSEIVHILVAKAFIPNPEWKRCINHKDGNKGNNFVDNLEWVSHSENMLHAYDTGLRKPKHHWNGRKHTEELKEKMRESHRERHKKRLPEPYEPKEES